MNLIEAWTDLGYAAFRDGGVLSSGPQRWSVLADAARRAISGDFGAAAELLPLVAADDDPATTMVALDMLGDWAPVRVLYQACTPLIGPNLPPSVGPGMMRPYQVARALARGGRLADVPALFRAVAETHGNAARNPERIDLSVYLGQIMGPLDAPDMYSSMEEYREDVGARYHELCNRYGTNLVYLFEGELFDVAALARRVLRHAGEGGPVSGVQLSMVAANTGISHDGFFRDGEPQRLTIAARLEEFLESDAAASFVPGERRFFGHVLEPATAAAADLQPSQISLFRDALNTDEPFAIGEWEWISRGYARMPRPYGESRDFEKLPWFSLASSVHRAMQGLEIPARAIAEHVARSNDPEFVQVASEFIADVSSDDLTAIWRARVEANDDPEITYLLCAALLRRGYLDDVPFVLQTYGRNEHHEGFHYLQLLLNELFWFAPEHAKFQYSLEVDDFSAEWLPFKSADECRREVEARSRALAASIGRLRAPVFRNEIFSVRRLAEDIVGLTEPEQLCLPLRYRFEGSTGIDCRAFYKDLQPDLGAAKEIAARFLANDGARYEVGERYFYGHHLAAR